MCLQLYSSKAGRVILNVMVNYTSQQILVARRDGVYYTSILELGDHPIAKKAISHDQDRASG
jgi:hypothetical protein